MKENSIVMSAEPTLACQYMNLTECLNVHAIVQTQKNLWFMLNYYLFITPKGST